MIQCPGCGGRNAETAESCDWCARPFKTNGPSLPSRRTVLPLALGFGLIALAVGAVVMLTSLSRPTGTQSGVVATSSPIPSASPRGLLPPALPTATSPVPSPPVTRRARVVNTSGQGALIRREPSVNAPNNGLVPENGVVELLGPEETVQAQVWRLVDDGQGNQGWIRADFLNTLEPPTPVPLAPTP